MGWKRELRNSELVEVNGLVEGRRMGNAERGSRPGSVKTVDGREEEDSRLALLTNSA